MMMKKWIVYGPKGEVVETLSPSAAVRQALGLVYHRYPEKAVAALEDGMRSIAWGYGFSTVEIRAAHVQ